MYMFALYCTHVVHFMYTNLYMSCAYTLTNISAVDVDGTLRSVIEYGLPLPFYARLEGLRAEVGFLAANQGFSSIEGTLFGFYDI